MASTTKTQMGPPRAAKRLAVPTRPSLPARLRARLDAVTEAMPAFAGSPRLRREVLGIALVLVALLTAVVLGRGGDDGRLVDWWGGVLADSFGQAAPLVPLLTGLAALRTLGNQPGPILEARHYLGGFLFAVAVVGLLQLGAGLAAPAGGYLGIAVATLTLRVLGQLGAGLAMFVVGVFAVFLLAGSDLQTFCADIRALFSLLGRGIARIARSAGRAIGVLYAAVAAAIGGVAGAVRRLRQGTGPNTAPAPAASPRGRAASVAPRERIPEPVLDPPIVRLPTPRRVTAVPQGLELPALQEIRDHPRLVPVPVALPPQLAPQADEEDGFLAEGEDQPDLRFAREPDPDLGFEPTDVGGRIDVSEDPDDDADVEAIVASGPPDTADDDPLDRSGEGEDAPSPPQAERSGDLVAAAAPRMVEASVSQAATLALPVPAAPPRPTLHPITMAHREVVATAAAGVGLEPLPDLGRLSYYDPVSPDTADLHAKARLIEATLNSFKVEARVREINPGPAVTQFALEPGTGIKVRRITELQNDLALALAAPSIRIEAPVPGHARVGLEIPNAHIATVGLRETLESQAMTKGKAKLPMPLGQDVNGRHVVGDLTRMPHILIAGATGAGKSVCLNCIISTFLLAKRPSDLKLVMIDPKMVELTGYNGVPHLQCPVVTEMDKVVGALRLTVREMERRYALFAQLGVRNYDGYRLKVADEPNAERIPYLVVIIDELADLMMTTPDEVETLLVRLGQMGRAAGIHLILATQRPSVDVVTGLIKTNVPSRIAFAVSSLTDSRVVLDMPGAERLLGRGDMLYLPADAAKPQRIQGAFLDDRDAQYVVDHWHGVAPVPNYAPEWIDLPSSNSGGGSGSGSFDPNEDGDDPLFDQALGIVKQQGNASASMLQRRLRVGYNRAARLIERMEDEGLIGPADGVRGRPVLFGDD